MEEQNLEQKVKRQVILDTETTGLFYKNGDRVVEIGCLEMVNKVLTGRKFHVYLNPEKMMGEDVIKIHGLTNEFLEDKPRFVDIADELLEFLEGSELVIHNAEFDVGMLNAELERANKGNIWQCITGVLDTLSLDKRLNPKEKKHTLDGICQRYGINLEERTFHGALLDCELLYQAYVKITENYSEEDMMKDIEQVNWKRPEVKRFNLQKPLPKINLTEKDLENHNNLLLELEKKNKKAPIFMKKVSNLKMN